MLARVEVLDDTREDSPVDIIRTDVLEWIVSIAVRVSETVCPRMVIDSFKVPTAYSILLAVCAVPEDNDFNSSTAVWTTIEELPTRDNEVFKESTAVTFWTIEVVWSD